MTVILDDGTVLPIPLEVEAAGADAVAAYIAHHVAAVAALAPDED